MTEQQGTFPWRLPEPGEQSLFDELAELVPLKRRAEYFRVLAHMQTLGPNDEMLRILQAMGILTLLTRQTPAEIANERKQLEELLRSTLSHVDEVDARVHDYVDKLDSRISQLPKDLEAGLKSERFQSTLACGERPVGSEALLVTRQVSIHARVWRATCIPFAHQEIT